MTPTPPYTFVTAAPPFDATLLGDGTPAVFDRPQPGRHTGVIDLHWTTLTPLYIGGTEPHSFSIDGRPIIPGSTLKGTVRGVVDAMFGGYLDPPGNREHIWYRAPIGDTPRYEQYRDHRGLTMHNPQRIGLLRRDHDSFVIRECPQFTFTTTVKGKERRYKAVPKVRRAVVRADLGIGATTKFDVDAVARWNFTAVWVVWAAIWTTGRRRNERMPPSVRRVPYAIGATEHDALDNARRRHDSGEHAVCLPAACSARDVKAPEFTGWVGSDGSYRVDTAPHATQMMLNATGLAHDATSTVSCYLFPLPDTPCAGWIAATDPRFVHPAPLRVHPDTLAPIRYRDSDDDDTEALSDYLTKLTPIDTLLDTPDSVGVPVFFDANNGEAVRVGRSGGFRIHAAARPADSLPESVRRGTSNQHLTVGESLFGFVSENDRARTRVEFGHAYCINEHSLTELSLPEASLTLLSPRLEADYLRLAPGTDGQPTWWDTAGPVRYRGREFYFHRWPATGTDAHRWNALVHSHRSQGVQTATKRTADAEGQSKTDTTIAPIRPGVRFASRIRFVNLTTAELGALVLALDLDNSHPGTATDTADPGGDNPLRAHKIGGARPVGLGSVRVDLSIQTVAQRYALHGTTTDDTPLDVPTVITACADTLRTAGLVAATDRWPTTIDKVLTVTQWRHRPAFDTWTLMTMEHHKTRTPAPDLDTLFGLTPS